MTLARWTDLPDWSGETVAILGGGPSLTAADAARVMTAQAEGQCRVIAINRSWELVPGADLLWGCDLKWWKWPSATEARTAFAGIMATQDARVPQQVDDRVRWLEASEDVTAPKGSPLRHGGFDPTPGRIRTGRNGGYQAMHLALAAGAARLLLLGYDLRFVEGASHWHGGHVDDAGAVRRPDDPGVYERYMLPCFPTLLPALHERGCTVVNCTPGSALTCFPSRPLEDVL